MAESEEPECQPCGGTGKVCMIFDIVPGRMLPEPMKIDCPKCGGTGRHTDRIRAYIANNPVRWADDPENISRAVSAEAERI